MNLALELPVSKSVVISRSELNKLKTEEVSKSLADFYKRFSRVEIVDNTKSFFSDENILSLVTGKSDVEISETIALLNMIFEKRKISINDSNWELIVDFLSFLEVFKQAIKENSSNIMTPYGFAAVPNNYDLKNKFTFTKNSIRLNSNWESLTINSAKQIWALASIIWANIDEDHTITKEDVNSLYSPEYNAEFINDLVRFGKTALLGETYQKNGRRYLNITSQSIRIGCTTLHRYEIEQIAKHLEFDFPK